MTSILKHVQEYHAITPVREVTLEYMRHRHNTRQSVIQIVESRRYADGTYERIMSTMEEHKEIVV